MYEKGECGISHIVKYSREVRAQHALGCLRRRAELLKDEILGPEKMLLKQYCLVSGTIYALQNALSEELAEDSHVPHIEADY